MLATGHLLVAVRSGRGRSQALESKVRFADQPSGNRRMRYAPNERRNPCQFQLETRLPHGRENPLYVKVA